MKTKTTLLASLLFASAIAGPAVAGPDFAGGAHGAKKLAASETNKAILPEEDVAFALNSAALLESSHQQIESVARWLKKNPKQTIVLEGHADSTGNAIHNEDLASRRADMVRMHLIGHGIKADRIIVIVYGEAEAKQKFASPIDRRVVLFATRERPEVISKRAMDGDRALYVMWTKKGVLFTETHGITPGAVATR